MDFDALNISLLFRLILSHLLADFIFQTDSMVRDRFRNTWHSKWLYIHGLIAGVLAYTLSGAFSSPWLFVAYSVSHILIDRYKSTKQDNLVFFIMDQFLHFSVIILTWALLTGPAIVAEDFISYVFLNDSIWVLLAAYVFVIWPSGYFIGKFTEPWHLEKDGNEGDGLLNAGLWIGRIERFLLLTFVLTDQYQAIGFLVAAKSIFRFTTDRKVSEYILIGTFMSFAIAIVTGIVTEFFIA